MYQNGIKKNDKTVGQHVLTPVVSVREKFEKIFVVTILNHPYILDKVIEDFEKQYGIWEIVYYFVSILGAFGTCAAVIVALERDAIIRFFHHRGT